MLHTAVGLNLIADRRYLVQTARDSTHNVAAATGFRIGCNMLGT